MPKLVSECFIHNRLIKTNVSRLISIETTKSPELSSFIILFSKVFNLFGKARTKIMKSIQHLNFFCHFSMRLYLK